MQKIVQDEQDANFISRLHAGQLNIVPWPVIESKQFYSLFPALKRRLDQQQITHQTAGEFLHTLKTLMAKLKVGSPACLSAGYSKFQTRLMIGAPCHVRYLASTISKSPLHCCRQKRLLPTVLNDCLECFQMHLPSASPKSNQTSNH